VDRVRFWCGTRLPCESRQRRRHAGTAERCGSSPLPNDAGVWLAGYPTLTQSAHSVRQVLTALVYEWKGAWPAKNRTWAYVREKMEELDRAGRIHYPKKGMPRQKRFESEYEGTVLQDVWTDINKIHCTWHPEVLWARDLRTAYPSSARALRLLGR
jgi:hypothetical protein